PVLHVRVRFPLGGLDGGTRGLRDLAERRGVVHREVREDLAIERHARDLQPMDQGRVRHRVHACGGVDAHDPEPPEIALLGTAVAGCESHRPLDLLLGDAVELGFREIVPLPPAKDLLSLETTLVSSFDSRHRILLFTGRRGPTNGRRASCPRGGSGSGPRLRSYLYGSMAWTRFMSAFETVAGMSRARFRLVV